MITASYMAAEYNVREEYLDIPGNIGYIGFDPIDAPNTIAAGSHKSIKAMTIDHYFVVPTCNVREF